MDSSATCSTNIRVTRERKRSRGAGASSRRAAIVGGRAARAPRSHLLYRNGRTVLADEYVEAPFRAGRRFSDRERVYVIVASSAPGAFGNDRLQQTVRLGCGASVRLSSHSGDAEIRVDRTRDRSVPRRALEYLERYRIQPIDAGLSPMWAVGDASYLRTTLLTGRADRAGPRGTSSHETGAPRRHSRRGRPARRPCASCPTAEHIRFTHFIRRGGGFRDHYADLIYASR